mmetsp:Transcript_8017/g.20042  ORF Transcript_8017/g.20042 Transcript_8017/m.20042 type:complete len:201 (+) Transcript_8017:373-975(+)
MPFLNFWNIETRKSAPSPYFLCTSLPQACTSLSSALTPAHHSPPDAPEPPPRSAAATEPMAAPIMLAPTASCSRSAASLSHLKYPTRFAPFNASAMTTTMSQLSSNLRTPMRPRAIHSSGVTYIVHQKMRASIALSAPRFSIVSKRHLVLVPSSSKSLHHLRPTSRRPVTFFTVQKSTASSVTVMTNWTTNEPVSSPNAT